MKYFDNAATTQVDPRVLESYQSLLAKYYANPSSLHKLGRETNGLIMKSREIISSLLGIKEDEIIFTSGASESNNLAIKGTCFNYQNRGRHIVTTAVEHPSVLKVFEQLENDFNFEVSYLQPNEFGVVTVEDVAEVLRDDTILVSIMFVNNEIGSIFDIEGIASYIKKTNPKTIFHCDATQGLGKIPLKLDNIDLLSLSAHKLHGLKGSGLLVKKNNVTLYPLIAGGHQEFGVRAGTSNFPTIVMLAKTLRIAYEEMQPNYEYVSKINQKIRNEIKNIDGVVVNSPENSSPYILNISFPGKKNAIVSTFFENNGICVSTVSACGSNTNAISYVIDSIYKDYERATSSIRLSFSKYTKMEDVDDLIKVIKRAPKEIIGGE